MKRAGNTDCFQLSQEETLVRYANAKQELKDFKPHASDYRKAHLKSLAKALAKTNKTSEESELKKLTNQEHQRTVGKKIKRFSKKGKKGLTRKAEHGPPENPVWTEAKDELEHLSAGVNEQRFSNCLTVSEFTTDPVLLADVGILCEDPAVDSILDGTYPIPEHLSHHTKTFLEFLPRPEVIKNNPMGKPTISKDDHVKGWQKARESTASEPSTLDFSHYISASYDEALAAMDATLREIPLQYGFAPDEWNPMTDCSIPKKEDSPRLEEMRTICLMDPAYNMNIKAYSRFLMHYNEPWLTNSQGAGKAAEQQRWLCKRC